MKEAASPKNTVRKLSGPRKPTSLIEFPGVTRTAMPEWRKELGERVREVQEKRAREASSESGEIGPLFAQTECKAAPLLELLPQAETTPMNPLVVAALRRIERAHSQNGGQAAVATALAYEEQPTVDIDPVLTNSAVSRPERIHNLAVVPTPEIAPASDPQEARKPRRVIDDQNLALNYLDSIPTSVRVDRLEYCSAPVSRRILSALTDLVVVALISSPFLALIELTKLEWRNPRVIGFAVATFLVAGFLYLTVSVAFTGRTIGMKLLSLRVVDARTGLIPTGSQSAGRSLVYLLSLASAGVALLYTFINSEKQTAHDRFTRTSVIRA
ncbi:MAG: RDD family protein [Acidobacteriota bacterium]